MDTLTPEQLTESLRTELQKSKEEINVWAANQKRAVEKIQADYEAMIGESAASVEALRTREKQLAQTRLEYEVLAQRQQEQIMRMKEELRLMKLDEKDRLPGQVDLLERELSEQQSLLSNRRSEATAARQAREEELNNLTRGVLFYKYLGLEFETLEEEAGDGAYLRLIFSQIDPIQPKRRFSFTVCVDDHDLYNVKGCDPALPQSLLDGYAIQLNRTNDFSAFVCAMRRSFVEIVKTTGRTVVA